ncbi:serine/threonine protein kinase [Nannocystis punicea]|uniref:non-specific serine/threonine protein kinase n=1 Tax=Nannocystis punicea TaxID=2995304 RepID=A0ABY7GXG7_9BACT|nr:protein kinase [Nannocystis poenicansa]WAS91657.1 protein kinase [Nannocystis poenicansa]
MSGSFAPRVGDRIANRYRLTALVRGGGPAQVFVAQDGQAREVTLVVLDPARCEPEAWASFAQVVEVATAAAIPGLSLLHGVGEAPPSPPHCLAEADVGRTFERLRAEEGRVPWQRALALGEQVAAILEAVDANIGLAHRALTSARCTVSEQGQVKILDYGIAEFEPMSGRTDESGYRAPEQQTGPGDQRSDVFSLAAILFELITSVRPSARSAMRLRSLISDVPQAVDDLFAQALALDPEERIPDAVALRATMRELLGLGPAPAPEPPAPAPVPAASESPAAARASAVESAPAIAPSAPPTLTIGGSSRELPAEQRKSVRSLAAALAPLEDPRRPLSGPVRSPVAGSSEPSKVGSLPPTARGAAALRLLDKAEVRVDAIVPLPDNAASMSGRIDRTEILPDNNATPAGRADKTEIFVEDKAPAGRADKTEIFVESKSPGRADKTEIFVESKSSGRADKTEIFVESKSPGRADKTEIFVESKSPGRADKTEIFIGNSVPAVRSDRTEIFVGSGALAAPRSERTELLPPAQTLGGSPREPPNLELRPEPARPAPARPVQPAPVAPVPAPAASAPTGRAAPSVKVVLVAVNVGLLLVILLVFALR